MCWLSSYCFGEIFVSRYDGVTGVFVVVSVDTECPKTQLNIIRKWAKAGVTNDDHCFLGQPVCMSGFLANM